MFRFLSGRYGGSCARRSLNGIATAPQAKPARSLYGAPRWAPFLTVVAVAALVALLVVPVALAVRVHVRIEGKTRTIFGATAPLIDVTSPRAGALPENALDALATASSLGEFYYHITDTSFGPYVDQIGRYAAVGQTGWVFKVNGVSPPVGANQVQLKQGDTVLWYWAQFGVAGGPTTLVLQRTRTNCYAAFTEDDNGARSPAAGAVLRVGSKRTVATNAGAGCVGKHRGLLVRATLEGAIRSNAVA